MDKTKTKNQLTPEQQKLIKETLDVIGEKLNLLKKVRVKDLLNYDVETDFYVDGDEDNHLYHCWFSYDKELKQMLFYGDSQDEEKIPHLGVRFSKKILNDFLEKESFGMRVSTELFKHFGNEDVLRDFNHDQLGYTIDYTKCFTVVRISDGKPYTGKEGEKPWVVYHGRYMNRLINGNEYWNFHLKQIMKVVNEKCRELGFTLEGKGGFVDVSERNKTFTCEI